MKSKLMKLLVSVLVIALLLQVPFALTSSASDLSQATGINFVLKRANPILGKGNVEVTMYATTDASAKVTTLGATLVIDTETFDLVNKSGVVITNNYKFDSVQLGSSFPLTAYGFDDGEGLESMGGCSLASYNADTKEMYLFIAGLNSNGVSVAANSKIASFYLKVKDGKVPSSENVRVMAASEYKDATACPSMSIPSAEISSKAIIFTPAAEDLVTDLSLTIDYIIAGFVDGTASFIESNPAAPITVELMKDDTVVDSVITNEEEGFGFTRVEVGTYSIRITAPGSLGYVIENVVVEEDEYTVIPPFELIYGNINGNDTIDLFDIASIIVVAAGNDTNDLADINGDGVVQLYDITKTITRFGVMKSKQIITIGEEA